MKLAKIQDGNVIFIDPRQVVIDGRIVFHPSVDTLRRVGIYPVVLVSGTGTDGVADGDHIALHTGNPAYVASERQAELQSALADTTPLVAALERIIAGQPVTDADREMATRRLLMRDELGKIIQTTHGTGDAFDPIKYWTEGMRVEAGKWYQCHDSNGYIWEAIKTGTPASDTDREFFDVVL